jgi:nitrite reductase/ring-hydroxylating ferredoxin subunit
MTDALGDELRHVFRAVPLVAAHASELAAPGDFVTVDAAGVPVLLVRDKAGELRAHVNVCRHRGTRLVSEARGHDRRAFVCPLHGWAYDLEGALFHLPRAEGFDHVDASKLGLPSVPFAPAFGLVWIALARGAVVDPRALVGADLARELDALDLGSRVAWQPTSSVKGVDWKRAVDAILDACGRADAARLDGCGPNLRFELGSATLFLLFPNAVLFVDDAHASVFTVTPTGAAACRVSTFALVSAASPGLAAAADVARLRAAVEERLAR